MTAWTKQASIGPRQSPCARAEDGDVALRLRRAPVLEGSPAELRIVNDGTPEDAVAQLLAHLRDRLAAG